MKWEIVPRDRASPDSALPAATTDTDPSAAGTLGFDFPILPIDSDLPGSRAAFGPAGIDAINPDYTIENLLLLLGTGGLGRAGRALIRALIRLGFPRSASDDAHHIVAQNARRADPARKILERLRIGIDDPANGVFLPRIRHKHLHSGAYYAAIEKALAGATTKSEAEEILRSIARRLAEGTFP
jgi:hypothetical protein